MKKNLLYAALLSPALLYLMAVGDGSGSSAASQTASETKDDHDGHQDEGHKEGEDAQAARRTCEA